MRLGLACLAALSSIASLAEAQVVDFESCGFANPAHSTLVVGAFQFSGVHFHCVSDFAPGGGIAANGSLGVLAAEGGASGSSSITMVRTDGAAFDVGAIDVSEMWLGTLAFYPNATQVRITGYLATGGTVQLTHTLDGILDGPGGAPDYETLLLPGFSGLLSMTFEGLGAGGVPDFAYCIDNIDPMCTASYGAGCAGTGGFTPTLAALGCTTAGGPVNITIAQGLGGSTAVMLVGVSQVSLPIGLSGCSLLVGAPQLPVAVPLGGAGGGPGAGSIQILASMPPSTSGLTIVLQAFVVDPAPPIGFAASNGLQLQIQ